MGGSYLVKLSVCLSLASENGMRILWELNRCCSRCGLNAGESGNEDTHSLLLLCLLFVPYFFFSVFLFLFFFFFWLIIDICQYLPFSCPIAL